MAGSCAPKQWTLTKDETLTSFTNWTANLLYILSLDSNFALFLIDSCTWTKKTPSSPTRRFVDDGSNVPAAQHRTAAQNCAHLDLLLGQIANCATVISRNTIGKGSFSLNHIWSTIGEHYGFQTTGSRFIDLTQIRIQSDKKPEDLYQRLVSFFDDNVVTIEGGLLHHGSVIDVDEDIPPSIENVIILLWLERIHPGLPGLVKQQYGAEVRNKTRTSIKPEISKALDALVNELQSIEESCTMRAQCNNRCPSPRSTSSKHCVLCCTANRQFDNHYVLQCKFLSERFTRIRHVESDVLDFPGDYPYEDPKYDDEKPSHIQQVIRRRVSTRTSPHMQCVFNQFPATVCIDTGAESCLISQRFVNAVGIPYQSPNHVAVQADVTISEVRNVLITRGAHTFTFDALVVKDDLGSDIVTGKPFLELNDVAVHLAKNHISITGKDVVPYASTVAFEHRTTCRIQTYVCQPQSACVHIICSGHAWFF